jgi:hypothetical protein
VFFALERSERIRQPAARPLKLAGGFLAIQSGRFRLGELALSSSGLEICPRAIVVWLPQGKNSGASGCEQCRRGGIGRRTRLKIVKIPFS